MNEMNCGWLDEGLTAYKKGKFKERGGQKTGKGVRINRESKPMCWKVWLVRERWVPWDERTERAGPG